MTRHSYNKGDFLDALPGCPSRKNKMGGTAIARFTSGVGWLVSLKSDPWSLSLHTRQLLYGPQKAPLVC